MINEEKYDFITFCKEFDIDSLDYIEGRID